MATFAWSRSHVEVLLSDSCHCMERLRGAPSPLLGRLFQQVLDRVRGPVPRYSERLHDCAGLHWRSATLPRVAGLMKWPLCPSCIYEQYIMLILAFSRSLLVTADLHETLTQGDLILISPLLTWELGSRMTTLPFNHQQMCYHPKVND
jgi:hypothetical protein